jgi:hypothetical protein
MRIPAIGLALLASSLCGAMQPAWIARYNGGLNRTTNQVVAMQLDGQGNILVSGSSTGAAGDYDYLTLKYAPNGTRLWVNRHPSLNNGDDQARAMAISPEGNIYVTGSFETVNYSPGGTLEWVAPFAGRDIALARDGSIYVTGFSSYDFATAKLNPNGSNEWVRTTDLFGGGYKDRADRIAIDEAGNIYVAGGGDYICQVRPPPRPTLCYSRFGIRL